MVAFETVPLVVFVSHSQKRKPHVKACLEGMGGEPITLLVEGLHIITILELESCQDCSIRLLTISMLRYTPNLLPYLQALERCQSL